MNPKKLPPVDDADILAYLEDAVSADLKAQIEASPQLLARAKQLEQAEARLRLFLAKSEEVAPDSEKNKTPLLARFQAEAAKLIQPIRIKLEPLQTPSHPQMALVRGAPSLPTKYKKVAFEGEDLFVVLEFIPNTSNSPRFDLNGYILGWDDPETAVQIWYQKAFLASIKLDEDDEFKAENLLPGQYEIKFIGTTIHLRLAAFNIPDSFQQT